MSTDQRTPESLRRHFEVERELAERLRESTREERPSLFGKLYDELFERVPDHPRLTRRETPEESKRSVDARLRLLRPHLTGATMLVEFAPGDCRLAYAAAEFCKKVIGIDISDQRAEKDVVPGNFELILYNGYDLDLPAASADIVFSYQFLEHLHPDDIDPHFAMAQRLVRSGGYYIFDTPHRYSGPHDISRHFGDTLQCFHFQEWTYRRMRALLRRHGFSNAWVYRMGSVRRGALFNAATTAAETALGILPKKLRRKLSARLFPAVTLMAQRD